MRLLSRDKAVKAALLHPKGAGMSDRQIADHVGVSNTFVGKCRVELKKDGHLSTDDTCRTGKDGKVYDTTNIGKTTACPNCGATELAKKSTRPQSYQGPFNQGNDQLAIAFVVACCTVKHSLASHRSGT